MTKALFTEKQGFRQKWLMAIIVVTLGIAVWAFVQQIILGIPFGNNPAPDGVLILLLLLPFALFGLFFSLCLHTRIDRQGITYRFAPVHRKDRLIKWDSVKQIEVRKYKPITEYGGWGFRVGKNGLAYNTGGNMGLQLVLKDGKKLLIGTQKADAMQKTLYKLEIDHLLN